MLPQHQHRNKNKWLSTDYRALVRDVATTIGVSSLFVVCLQIAYMLLALLVGAVLRMDTVAIAQYQLSLKHHLFLQIGVVILSFLVSLVYTIRDTVQHVAKRNRFVQSHLDQLRGGPAFMSSSDSNTDNGANKPLLKLRQPTKQDVHLVQDALLQQYGIKIHKHNYECAVQLHDQVGNYTPLNLRMYYEVLVKLLKVVGQASLIVSPADTEVVSRVFIRHDVQHDSKAAENAFELHKSLVSSYMSSIRNAIEITCTAHDQVDLIVEYIVGTLGLRDLLHDLEHQLGCSGNVSLRVSGSGSANYQACFSKTRERIEELTKPKQDQESKLSPAQSLAQLYDFSETSIHIGPAHDDDEYKIGVCFQQHGMYSGFMAYGIGEIESKLRDLFLAPSL